MKEGIHPNYQFVVYRDAGANFTMLTRSTSTSEQKFKWTDGKDYPCIDVDISSASHPFFTGTQRLVDSAGRVEKFQKKYGKNA